MSRWRPALPCLAASAIASSEERTAAGFRSTNRCPGCGLHDHDTQRAPDDGMELARDPCPLGAHRDPSEELPPLHELARPLRQLLPRLAPRADDPTRPIHDHVPRESRPAA